MRGRGCLAQVILSAELLNTKADTSMFTALFLGVGKEHSDDLGTQSTYGNLDFLRCSSENLAFGSCHRIIPWRRLKIISHEVHVVGYNHQFCLNVIFLKMQWVILE